METIGTIIGILLFLGTIGGFFFLIFYIVKKLVNRGDKKNPQIKTQTSVEEKSYENNEVVDIQEYEDHSSVKYGDGSVIIRNYDEFDKTINFNFSWSSGFGQDTFPVYGEVYLGFGFKKIDNDYHLIIESFKKEFIISKNDELDVLFDDKKIQKFIIEKKGVFKEKDLDGIKIGTSLKLDPEIFQLFLDCKIDKIRYLKSGSEEKFDFNLDIKESSKINQMASNLYDCSENILIEK